MAAQEEHFDGLRKGAIMLIPFTIAGVCFSIYFYQYFEYILLATIIFDIQYFFSRYIDPDLDLQGMTGAESRMVKELLLLGAFMKAYWSLYADIMYLLGRSLKTNRPLQGAHRSVLTHTLFPGTLIRLLWMDLPFVIIGGYLNLEGKYSYIATIFIAQYLSMCYSDAIHLILDKEPHNGATRNRSSTGRSRHRNTRSARRYKN